MHKPHKKKVSLHKLHFNVHTCMNEWKFCLFIQMLKKTWKFLLVSTYILSQEACFSLIIYLAGCCIHCYSFILLARENKFKVFHLLHTYKGKTVSGVVLSFNKFILIFNPLFFLFAFNSENFEQEEIKLIKKTFFLLLLSFYF